MKNSAAKSRPDKSDSAEAELLGLPRLHRPVRAWWAVGELFLIGLAIWGGFWLWDQAITTVTTITADGSELVSRHYAGDFVGGAIALGTVAALLGVDALRQLTLAFYARHRRPRAAKQQADLEIDDDLETHPVNLTRHQTS